MPSVIATTENDPKGWFVYFTSGNDLTDDDPLRPGGDEFWKVTRASKSMKPGWETTGLDVNGCVDGKPTQYQIDRILGKVEEPPPWEYKVERFEVAGTCQPLTVFAVTDGEGKHVFDKLFAWEHDAHEWALELTIGRRDDPRLPSEPQDDERSLIFGEATECR